MQFINSLSDKCCTCFSLLQILHLNYKRCRIRKQIYCIGSSDLWMCQYSQCVLLQRYCTSWTVTASPQLHVFVNCGSAVEWCSSGPGLRRGTSMTLFATYAHWARVFREVLLSFHCKEFVLVQQEKFFLLEKCTVYYLLRQQLIRNNWRTLNCPCHISPGTHLFIHLFFM